MSLDIGDIMVALENENNCDILELDYASFNQMKNDSLQRLSLPREILKKYSKSLKFYRCIDELQELTVGAYIRWINLERPENIKLTTGGVICDIKIDEEISILCRNKMNGMFQLKFSFCLIFQKLTDQEKVLLSALKYLQ